MDLGASRLADRPLEVPTGIEEAVGCVILLTRDLKIARLTFIAVCVRRSSASSGPAQRNVLRSCAGQREKIAPTTRLVGLDVD